MASGKRLTLGFGLALTLMIAITGFGVQEVDLIERIAPDCKDSHA